MYKFKIHDKVYYRLKGKKIEGIVEHVDTTDNTILVEFKEKIRIDGFKWAWTTYWFTDTGKREHSSDCPKVLFLIDEEEKILNSTYLPILDTGE